MKATLRFALLALVACSTSEPSLVIVHVDAQEGVRRASGSYTLRVEGRAEGAEFRDEFVETYREWGRDFTLGPQDHDASRSYRVTLTAYDAPNAAGDVVATNVLVSGYVPSQTRRYELILYDACQGRTCSEDQRCDIGGLCQPAEIPPTEIPVFDAGSEDGGSLPDTSTDVPVDAVVDRDGGPDAGGDGGRDGGSDGGPPTHDGGVIPCDSLPIIQVSAGRTFTCALSEERDIFCWGDNTYAQASPVDGAGPLEPTLVSLSLPSGFAVVDLQAGDEHACALAKGNEGQALSGRVYCWGRNQDGQNRLGVSAAVGPHLTIEGGAVALSVGGWHACAAMEDDSTQCWGQNFSGELGRGNNMRNQSVGPTVGPRADDTHVLAGFGNSCGYQQGVADAVLECWGFDGNGAVGAPVGGLSQWTHRTVSLPAADSAFHTIVTLSASHSTTPSFCNQPTNEFGGTSCGVFATSAGDTKLYCWGSNGCQQVNSGTRNAVTRPDEISSDRFPANSRDWLLDVGGGTVCAARRTAEGSSRTLFCWGDASSSKLLSDETTPSAVPVPMLDDVDDVSVGFAHVCAVSAGRVYCWGSNTHRDDDVLRVTGQTLPGGGLEDVGEPTCVSIR